MAQLSDATLHKKLANTGHAHFCNDRSCRQIYDCLDVRTHQCETRVNGRCHTCRGLEAPVWTQVRAPQPCCVNNVRQVTDRDELYAHRLGGPGPWFKCKTCARCHGWPQGRPTST